MAKKRSTLDVEHLRKIGQKGGLKTKRSKGKAYFSRIAKLSHPKNNPDAKRKKYCGGRPPSSDSAAAD